MRTSAGDERAAEFRRLADVSSIISAMACCVGDLVQLAPEQLPDWLKRLGVPPGWRTASVEGASVTPARIVLRGQHPDRTSADGGHTDRRISVLTSANVG
jgi:hypothetical protein